MNVVARHRIAFAAIPKAACSSVKTLFFEFGNGTRFTLFRANGKSYDIHDFYPSRHARGYRPEDHKDQFRFAILRKSVKRFLSWFHAVYPIERIDECAARLSELCHRPVTIPHRQQGGRKFAVADQTAPELAKIVDFYKADDASMADYDTPPELPADAATCTASPPEQHQKRADT